MCCDVVILRVTATKRPAWDFTGQGQQHQTACPWSVSELGRSGAVSSYDGFRMFPLRYFTHLTGSHTCRALVQDMGEEMVWETQQDGCIASGSQLRVWPTMFE